MSFFHDKQPRLLFIIMHDANGLTSPITRRQWRSHSVMHICHKQIHVFLISLAYIKRVQRAAFHSSLHGG